MKKFKKVYIEITNKCNLNCYFCNKHKREYKDLSLEEFKIILNKIKPYTKYIYLHLMGEPLLHNNINEFIDIASNDFFVNITTNGTLLEKIKYNKNIRQINISLHSINNKKEYLNNIFYCVDELIKNNTIINYRFWVNGREDYIEEIKKYYGIKEIVNNKICNNIFIDFDKEFTWPNLDNKYYKEDGKCRGLKDHIGILSNGDIVPCCLDSNGIIKLGNIFDDSLVNIINSDRFVNMLNGFNNNKRIEELCKHCDFY